MVASNMNRHQQVIQLQEILAPALSTSCPSCDRFVTAILEFWPEIGVVREDLLGPIWERTISPLADEVHVEIYDFIIQPLVRPKTFEVTIRDRDIPLRDVGLVEAWPANLHKGFFGLRFPNGIKRWYYFLLDFVSCLFYSSQF